MIRARIGDLKVALRRLFGALSASGAAPRHLGPGRPGFEIPASFFEPLPEDLQRALEGHDA